jgi:hypothetical protein
LYFSNVSYVTLLQVGGPRNVTSPDFGVKETMLGSLSKNNTTSGYPFPVLTDQHPVHSGPKMTGQRFQKISEVNQELRVTDLVAQRSLVKQPVTDSALYPHKGLIIWGRQKLEAEGDEVTDTYDGIISDPG